MVVLRVEELEPRLMLSGEDYLGFPLPLPPTSTVALPRSQLLPNPDLSDNVGVLIRQLRSGSANAYEFFANLNAWIFLSLKPMIGVQPPRPDADPNAVISSRWGSCGSRHAIMAEAAARLGFSATMINLTNVPYQGGHTATGILIDGAWRFFDSTSGVYFTIRGGTKPCSLPTAALRYPEVDIWQARGSFWTGQWHYAREFVYTRVTTNILRWNNSAVFDIARTYFPFRISPPDVSRQMSGDFNGDSRPDLAYHDSQRGGWWVALATADGGVQRTLWGSFAFTANTRRAVGDFNGDGRDDLALYHVPRKTWWVGLATADNRFSFVPWLTEETQTVVRWPLAGDFNGDGRDDLAAYHPGQGTWWIALSQGDRFVTQSWGSPELHRGWSAYRVGDFNNDGRDDMAMYHGVTRTWWVGLSQEAGFAFQNWVALAVSGLSEPRVGDFDGDGVDDVLMYRKRDRSWWIGLSAGDKFVFQRWAAPDLGQVRSIQVGDLNDDGRDDVVAYQVATRRWWVGHSSGAGFTFQKIGGLVSFSSWSVPVIGDFNGDGRDDIGLHRPFNSVWWAAFSPSTET